MKRAYAIAALSFIGGITVHLMVILVIQVENPLVRQLENQQAPIRYVGNLRKDAARSIHEQAALNDSAPLFMPTRWNLVSEVSDVASLKEATEIFQPFPARLSLLGAGPASLDPSGSRGDPQKFRLPHGSAFVLSRYGRRPDSGQLPVSAGASFVVRSLDTPDSEHTRHALELPEEILSNAPPSLWNPVQILLHLSGGLPIGLPMVGQSSGFAEWDASLQAHFSSLGFYRGHRDGYYQIWVYP